MKRQSRLPHGAQSYRPALPPEAGQLVRRHEAEGVNALIVGWASVEIERNAREFAIQRATIPIYGAQALGYDLVALAEVLRELFLFVLTRDIEITFENRPFQEELGPTSGPRQALPSLCLFSGGVDSYAGILMAKQAIGAVDGVFCAHSDQSKVIRLVERLGRRPLAQEGISLHKAPGPSLGSQGYVQLRGFLYVLGAGLWISRFRASRLLVTECGPTMFQPQFSPLDAVTMTTHPVVMHFAGKALAILMRRPILLVTPFAEWTKAEVMAASPRRQGLSQTHSCISQRFGSHDGTCYGCVVRRLAAIAAGVKDVLYRRNPLWDERASGGNLLSLLTFCRDLLLDYRGMEEYERRGIDQYRKQDLFRRFALDNYAAVHALLGQRKRLRGAIRRLYSEVISVLGKGAFDNRLEELRTATGKIADFG
jgi:hypothetical protein